MPNDLFIGNNVIQSNWDTDSFVMNRHQLRARVEESTVYVQVVEQNLIERIGTWLSHLIGQNKTYAHQLKLTDINIKPQNIQALNIDIQKILNNGCQLDETQNFDIQNVIQKVLHDLGGQFKTTEQSVSSVLNAMKRDKNITIVGTQESSQIDKVIDPANSMDEIKLIAQNTMKGNSVINSESTVGKIENPAAIDQSLLDEMVDGWQSTVVWLIKGLEQAKKECNTKDREAIESAQKALDASWLDVSQQFAVLDPETKEAINFQIKGGTLSKIDLPFEPLLIDTTGFMVTLYDKAGRLFPDFQPKPSTKLDRECLEFGVLPIYVEIQKSLEFLESQKMIPSELTSKLEPYNQELFQLIDSIKTMTGEQLQKAIVDFSDRHSGILQYVIMISQMVIMASQVQSEENHITPEEVAKDLKELIEKAYAYRHDFAIGTTPVLEASLGQMLGTWSPDNTALMTIRDKDFSHSSKEDIKRDAANAINLIKKGFEQALLEVPETQFDTDDRNINQMIINLKKKIQNL